MNRDPLNKEFQKDPIFLLQKRDYTLTCCPSWLAYDGDFFWIEYKNLNGFDTSDWDFIIKGYIDDRLLFDYLERTEIETDVQNVAVTWQTESVWLTRFEAEQFAKATEYNYHYGWRVRCVSACGKLAEILKSAEVPIPSVI